jgi:hypothetical protein
MRPLAFSIVGLVALAVCATVLFYRASSKVAALSVVPTGQPSFQTFLGVTEVLLPVAVTNNTGVTLSYCVGAAPRDQFRANFSFSGGELFALGPRSGKLCTVHYDPSYPPGWVLAADYVRARSPAEVKLRNVLFQIGVPGVTTNDAWHHVLVGQIVQH